MYTVALLFHSYWRWVVVVLGLWTLARAVRGWASHRGWSGGDERLSRWFIGALDAQVMVGLLMYFLWSPFSQAVFHDFRAAMKVPTARFFGLEHITTMVIAFVVAHVGRARLKRMEAAARPRSWAITVGIWLILVAAAFPWPWTAHGRPWIRVSF